MYEEIYPEEFYEFEQIFGELINEEMLGYVLAVVAVIGLVVGIVSLACYIFQSLGLYTIASAVASRIPGWPGSLWATTGSPAPSPTSTSMWSTARRRTGG